VKRACELEPHNASYWGLLGIRCLGTFRFKEALDACERGLEIDPEDSNSWSCRTSLLFFQGHTEEALEDVRSNLARDANNASTHMMHGLALLHSGLVDEAADSFRESLRIDPENAHGHKLLRSTQGLERLIFLLIAKLREGPGLWLFPLLGAWLALSGLAPEKTDSFLLPAAIALGLVRLLLLCALVIPPGLSIAFSTALRKPDWPRTLCWLAGLVCWSLPDFTDAATGAPYLSVLFLFSSLSFHLAADGRKRGRTTARSAGWALTVPTLLLSLGHWLQPWERLASIASALGFAWCVWYGWYSMSPFEGRGAGTSAPKTST
jgi:Tetratricopeptide repeat